MGGGRGGEGGGEGQVRDLRLSSMRSVLVVVYD